MSDSNRNIHLLTQTAEANSAESARDTYGPLGELYDSFTAADRYDIWLAILDDLIKGAAVLPGRHLLDVGCGTGKSTIGMEERGYSATGCDISETMLSYAMHKAKDLSINFVQADMRKLPLLGEFDVALAMDDVFNHLLTEDDFAATLKSIHRQLRPGGLLVFDVNTLYAYRHWYASTFIPVGDASQFMVWKGHATPDHAAGTQATSTLTIFTADSAGTWKKTTTSWRQLHHPTDRIADLLAKNGFTVVDAAGLHRGELRRPLSDIQHNKAIWTARAVQL